jgi:hypothetical protein
MNESKKEAHLRLAADIYCRRVEHGNFKTLANGTEQAVIALDLARAFVEEVEKQRATPATEPAPEIVASVPPPSAHAGDYAATKKGSARA